jgi:hypothetical protein
VNVARPKSKHFSNAGTYITWNLLHSPGKKFFTSTDLNPIIPKLSVKNLAANETNHSDPA